jgi:hypothetical protein
MFTSFIFVPKELRFHIPQQVAKTKINMKITSLVLGYAALVAAVAHEPSLFERQQSNSFAGVNSFFLHAFKEYVGTLCWLIDPSFTLHV